MIRNKEKKKESYQPIMMNNRGNLTNKTVPVCSACSRAGTTKYTKYNAYGQPMNSNGQLEYFTDSYMVDLGNVISYDDGNGYDNN